MIQMKHEVQIHKNSGRDSFPVDCVYHALQFSPTSTVEEDPLLQREERQCSVKYSVLEEEVRKIV